MVLTLSRQFVTLTGTGKAVRVFFVFSLWNPRTEDDTIVWGIKTSHNIISLLERWDQLTSKTQVPTGTAINIRSIFLCPLQVHLEYKNLSSLYPFSLSVSVSHAVTANNIQQIIIIQCIVFGDRRGRGNHPARVCIWTYWKIILVHDNRDTQMPGRTACLSAIVLPPEVIAGQSETRSTSHF